MTDSPNVFLLKDSYRVVGTDGRVSGNWHVLLDERRGTAWVTPQCVTIYDETRRSGVVLYSESFTARVGREVHLSVRGHRFEADIEEVREELSSLLARIAETAWNDHKPSDP